MAKNEKNSIWEGLEPESKKELLHDWLNEIEQETVVFLEDGKRAEPEAVARHLRLGVQSATFILDKLSGEGRIHPEAGEGRDPEPG